MQVMHNEIHAVKKRLDEAQKRERVRYPKKFEENLKKEKEPEEKIIGDSKVEDLQLLHQDKVDKDGYKIKTKEEKTTEWKEEVLRSHMVEVPHKDTVDDIRRNIEMALSYKEQATIE